VIGVDLDSGSYAEVLPHELEELEP
jgi:hypothetical protein